MTSSFELPLGGVLFVVGPAEPDAPRFAYARCGRRSGWVELTVLGQTFGAYR